MLCRLLFLALGVLGWDHMGLKPHTPQGALLQPSYSSSFSTTALGEEASHLCISALLTMLHVASVNLWLEYSYIAVVQLVTQFGCFII